MGSPPQPPQASYAIDVQQDRVLVSLSGEFDLVTEAELEGFLRQAILGHPGVRVDVDMSRVGFLDSSGIRALLRAHGLAAERGSDLRLIDTRGTVREVLEIVDVYDLLTGAAS